MAKGKIKFILAEDLILVHCPKKETARHLVLELLLKVIESESLELAPRPEKLSGKSSDIVDYINSL